MNDFPERNELVKKYNSVLGTMNLMQVERKMEAKLKKLGDKADDAMVSMLPKAKTGRIHLLTVKNQGAGSKLAIVPNQVGSYDLSITPTVNFRVPPRLGMPTYMLHTLFVELQVDKNYNVIKTKRYSYLVNGAIRKIPHVPKAKNTPLKTYIETLFLGVMTAQLEKDLKDAIDDLEYEKKMKRQEGVKFESFIAEAEKNPIGRLYKDKNSKLWLIVGGSKSSPVAMSFDPKWAQIGEVGIVSSKLLQPGSNDRWIDWTTMVKKPIIKKFEMAAEMELFDFEAGERSVLKDGKHGVAALKYLSKLGR